MIVRRWMGLGVLMLGLGGCFGSAPTSGPAPSEPLVEDEQAVDLQLGKRVRVVGEAQNTWSGASVVDGELVVHIDEFRKWPHPIIGKKVEVVGRLERGAAADPKAAQATPTVVLRQASYLLVD